MKSNSVGLVCFDLETELFSEQFRRAWFSAGKVQYAPRMRLACVYRQQTGRYEYFEPNGAQRLVKLLLAASRIVSFNGEHFDFPVLQRWYGFPDRSIWGKKSVDVQQMLNPGWEDLIFQDDCLWRTSLDYAAWFHLGERKHTAGRDMINMSMPHLKRACRSDVRQTYQLYRLCKNMKREQRIPVLHREIQQFEGQRERKCLVCDRPLEYIQSYLGGMSRKAWKIYADKAEAICVCRKCHTATFWLDLSKLRRIRGQRPRK